MAARLFRCTRLWGTSDWIDAEPGLKRLPGAIYRPWSADTSWGLYADGCRIGDGSPDPVGDVPPDIDGGPFLYVGSLATHYGHFLVNTLPMLWPLVAGHGQRWRLLCHMPGPRHAWEGLPFLGAILGQLGYGSSDIVTFDRPIRLGEVVVPDPALREQTAVHGVFADLCRAIGRPLWRDVAVDSEPRPVYLSKTRLTLGVAHVTNEQAIVEELERRGVEIVFPETLSFADQVRLISTRRIVMGTAGSAFHTVAFAAPGRRLVGLNWQQAINANLSMLDRINGARTRYYHPYGTQYGDSCDWRLTWTVEDPRGVAEALLLRAHWLDRGLTDEEGVLAAIERFARRPFGRT